MTHDMEKICGLVDRFDMDWIKATQILDWLEDIDAKKWIDGLEKQYLPEPPE